MRVRSGFLLLAVALLLPPPTLSEECGTIERSGASFEPGDAPSRGSLTIEPCGGPGTPGPRLERDLTTTTPEFTEDWADMSWGTGGSHSTSSTQILPGGNYSFGDYQVPAGVTLIYTGPVSIRAQNVRINGTVRTDSPGASIQIRATERFLIEGVEPDAAVVETRGADSPIEIGAQFGVTGKYRSEIVAEHGNILISSGQSDPDAATNLDHTDVRAKDGALHISSVYDTTITEGYVEGNGGGIKLYSRSRDIELADLILYAGSTGPGIHMQADNSIRLEGRADIASGAGPIVVTALSGSVSLDDVYSVYTDSGDQLYLAGQSVSLVRSTYASTNTGDVLVSAGALATMSGTSVLSSVEGDITIQSRLFEAKLVGDSLVHTNRGRIRVDAAIVQLRDRARMGRGSFAYGPIEVRCGRLSTNEAESQSHIHGSTVALHVEFGAELGPGLVRAETGDLVMRSTGTIAGPCRLEARGGIRVDSDLPIDLTDAEIRTDDVTAGASGPVRIRNWGGSSGRIDLTGARVTSGDAATASGDIEVLVGTSRPEVPSEAYILPKRVKVKFSERDPSRSRITVSGFCDLGSGTADLTAAATLEVGLLDIAVPGMVAKAGGRKYRHKTTDVKFSITPAKSGSSRAKFKVALTADLSGMVDPSADLTLRFVGAGVDGSGTVRLTKGKYALGKVRGALVEPGLYLAKAKASVRGAGKDKVSLLLGLTTDGSTPAAAPDFTIAMGDDVAATIPAASFTRSGDRYKFRGDVDGITRVVLDYARETIQVKGKGLDLGAVPQGPVEVDVSVGLGDETRAIRVRMVRSGKSLRY